MPAMKHIENAMKAQMVAVPRLGWCRISATGRMVITPGTTSSSQ